MARKRHPTSEELQEEELMQLVVSLRKAGHDYVQIAVYLEKQLGVRLTAEQSRKLAQKAINRYRELLAEDIADVIWLELARMDEALRSIWPKVKAGDKDAVAVFIKLSESRRKLLGLDQPQRMRLQADDSLEVVLRWNDVSGENERSS